jgi:hypothetical protein
MKLSHGLLVRNVSRRVLGERFLDPCAEPSFIAGLWFAQFLLKRRESFLVGSDEQLFGQPVSFVWRQLPSLVEKSLRVRAHGEDYSVESGVEAPAIAR